MSVSVRVWGRCPQGFSACPLPTAQTESSVPSFKYQHSALTVRAACLLHLTGAKIPEVSYHIMGQKMGWLPCNTVPHCLHYPQTFLEAAVHGLWQWAPSPWTQASSEGKFVPWHRSPQEDTAQKQVLGWVWDRMAVTDMGTATLGQGPGDLRGGWWCTRRASSHQFESSQDCAGTQLHFVSHLIKDWRREVPVPSPACAWVKCPATS